MGSVTLGTDCFQVIVPLPEMPLYFPVPVRMVAFPGPEPAATGLFPLALQNMESPFAS